MGGSAESTNKAASHSESIASAASVLCTKVEPTPGVSTSTIPRSRKSERAPIVTLATLSRLRGFCASEIWFSSTLGISCAADVTSGGAPLLNATLTQVELLAWTKVGMAVTGVTPVGNRGTPRSAFSRVLFPRLNCPRTATRNRPSSKRSRRSRSLSSIRSCASLGSGTDVIARVKSWLREALDPFPAASSADPGQRDECSPFDFLPSGQIANARYWIAECVKATKLEAYLRISVAGHSCSFLPSMTQEGVISPQAFNGEPHRRSAARI